jgi:nucleoside phosphorylase
MLSHHSYSVGWVSALSKELTAARAMLDKEHPDLPKPPNDPNTYTLGSIGEHNVVMVCLPLGRMGTNPAATVGAFLISAFPCIKFILMVGIGGGIPPKVRLGDVVVSTPVATYSGIVQWDYGKARQGRDFEHIGMLNLPPTTLSTAVAKLKSDHDMAEPEIPMHLKRLADKFPTLRHRYLRSPLWKDMFFKADYQHVENDTTTDDMQAHTNGGTCLNCDEKHAVPRDRDEMRVHYGLIASGNSVIKDAIVRDNLNKDYSGHLLCVEMEAAGLMNSFPCMVIRGICDYADSHKNDIWQEHAAAVAAAYAKELLNTVPQSNVESEPLARETVARGESSSSFHSGLLPSLNRKCNLTAV